jgi:hypothetical protein
LRERIDLLTDELHGPVPGRKIRIGQEAETVLPPALGVSPFEGCGQIAGLSRHIADSSRPKTGPQNLVYQVRIRHVVGVQPNIDVRGAFPSGGRRLLEEALRHEAEAFVILGHEIAVLLQERQIARFRERREETLSHALGK